MRISNLKEKEKENALNEVRLLASISCEFIIKYKEAFFDTPSNTLCIVIEYADGGDLEVTAIPFRKSSKRRKKHYLGSNKGIFGLWSFKYYRDLACSTNEISSIVT